MIFYVYIITDSKTGQFYIGSRQCNCSSIDDTYMGSTVTWNPESEDRLVKKILKEERSIKFKKNNPGKNKSKDTIKKIRKSVIKWHKNNEHPRLGKGHTNQAKEKMKNNHADFNGENNPMYGKKRPNITELMKRSVKNIKTSEVYESVTETATMNNVSRTSIHYHCSGKAKNPKFKYITKTKHNNYEFTTNS